MAGSDASSAGSAGLRNRVLVGIALAVCALAAIWWGNWSFALLMAAASMLAFREWIALVGLGRPWYSIGLVVIAATVALSAMDRAFDALLLLCGAILLVSMASRNVALGAGLSYAALPAIALVWLRGQPDGFQLVLWTMAIVWMTDIFAYFAGRGVGGPKIWPAISPSKTWAGLAGGITGAMIFSVAFAAWVGWDALAIYALCGAALAVVAQAGDFFESWMKRCAGVKDSGNLLGGHGGVLDRVDGLVPVAVVVALWIALA